MAGAVISGAGRAYYLFDGDKKKIDVSALSYSYQGIKPKLIDLYDSSFSDARKELVNLQSKMAKTKNLNSFFNWNNERDLNKNILSSVNNFFLLQLLTLENETIKQSLIQLALNCSTDSIYLDFDINAEKLKIFNSYKELENLNLKKELEGLRRQHQKPGSTSVSQ